jgi:hypothetical protein
VRQLGAQVGVAVGVANGVAAVDVGVQVVDVGAADAAAVGQAQTAGFAELLAQVGIGQRRDVAAVINGVE